MSFLEAGRRRLREKAYISFLRGVDDSCPLTVTIAGGVPFKILLPEQVSAELYKKGESDIVLREWMNKNLGEGMAASVIGARIGYSTLMAARLVGETGQVSAFEPTPWLSSVLEENLRKYPWVKPFSKFVGMSDLPQIAYRHSIAGPVVNCRRLTSLAAVSVDEFDSRKLSLSSTSLDKLVNTGEIRTPNVIIVECCGTADTIFYGARNLLSASHPKILFEIGGPADVVTAPTLDLLVNQFGYNSFHQLDQRGVLVDHTLLRSYPKKIRLVAEKV